ncbi:hypothetical protein GCM10010912_31200 [Paenibacillus albidus]|uniref:Uncharacterized protein n=1 Tax=Paenibacillus albidus TaxID=2041023 RepID=A0A917CC23_9BACL|nr:hypothetical protein [Paenibacillus albidus]GGF83799.1 hypothetical protein GCM10010912_31200 [Paenibacillus albidus]
MFQYQIISPTAINLKYEYGGEYFTFNLFRKDEVWILHPFDGILLGNQAMCVLVVQDLFTNKAFQVMLAKENILFSNLRSSVDLDHPNIPIAASNDRESYEDPDDDLMAFVQQHTIEEVIAYEHDLVKQRVAFYKDILQRMFMDDLGPSDREFQKVQEIVRIYEDAADRLSRLNGTDLNLGDRRRW